MFQQYTTQECEQCGNLQYVRQAETLTVSVEAGTPDGHVSSSVVINWSLAFSQSLSLEAGTPLSSYSVLPHDLCSKKTDSRRPE